MSNKPRAELVDRLVEAITNLEGVLSDIEPRQELQGESSIQTEAGHMISFYIDGPFFQMERHAGTIRAEEMSLGDNT